MRFQADYVQFDFVILFSYIELLLKNYINPKLQLHGLLKPIDDQMYAFYSAQHKRDMGPYEKPSLYVDRLQFKAGFSKIREKLIIQRKNKLFYNVN